MSPLPTFLRGCNTCRCQAPAPLPIEGLWGCFTGNPLIATAMTTAVVPAMHQHFSYSFCTLGSSTALCNKM